MIRLRAPFLLALCGSLLLGGALRPASLAAQASAPAAASTRPANVVSVNPFLPLAGYFQGEFERRLRDNLAFALGVSYVDLEDRATNVDAKLRLYPQEKAPYGLGLAAGLGVGHLRDEVYSDVTCTAIGCPSPGTSYRSTNAPAFSVEIHYQWLLGRKQNTAVGFGFGAKRYFVSDNTDQYGGDRYMEFVPTGRITIGYAFGR